MARTLQSFACLSTRSAAVGIATFILAVAAVSGAEADARLLLLHSFDHGLASVDFARGQATVATAGDVAWREKGVFGRAAGFDMGVREAALTVTLDDSVPATQWTLAFFLRPEAKEVMTTPRDSLLTVLDQHGDTLLGMDVSGNVALHLATGGTLGMSSTDAAYWIAGENIHLAVTFDADASSVARPRGVATVYWNGRPYGASLLDLGDRRPATIRFGGNDLAVMIDELHLFGAALPLPALVELARRPQGAPDALSRRIGERMAFHANHPSTLRRQRWSELAKAGRLFEAESGSGGTVVSGWHAPMTSGTAYMEANATDTLDIPFELAAAGDHALALRYSLDRRFDPMWPVRDPEARTEWSANATTIEVLLNGEPLATERLYPTGIHDGHSGDVDPWTWHPLAHGTKVALEAGRHVLQIRPVSGLAWPRLDAVLVGREPGPAPPHPRWVDQYRVPPAWWVANRKTETRRRGLFGRERVDTYTISLRNRNDEPYAAGISLEQDMLGSGQTAATDTARIALAPHEEKAFDITFRSASDADALSGYLRVILWNEDSPQPMEYRLWNVVPEAFHADTPHPRLLPAPDPDMQRQFREWLAHRAPARLTAELRRWAAGPDRSTAPAEYRVLAHRMNLFPAPLLGERLEILDMWMAMTEEDLAAYLPKAAAENAGYGLCWDKVNNAVAGHWAGPSFDYRTTPPAHAWKPEGNLDLVTELTAHGMNRSEWSAAKRPTPDKATIPILHGAWTREQQPDVFAGLRNLRWCMMAGMSFGSMTYQSADMPNDSGIPLVAEAYYLTGDDAYAQQAYRMARVFAREYTVKTRQFLFRLYREDRNWWGTRWHNRYIAGMGQRVIQRLGTGILDLCWNGLSEAQRTVIEHNLIRFGMYEATYGPLWDDPDKGAKVNREDPPPFVPAGLVLGDPGPRRGLQDFFRLVNKMVLSDGMHICSIGTYGGTREYLNFMRLLHDLGVDVVSDNPALRQSFLTHPRFVFACGSLQPMDDGGGGQGHLGLDPTYGAPTREQYEWGHELFGDALFPHMWDFLAQLGREAHHRVRGSERAERIRRFYAGHADGRAGTAGRFPLRDIWPPVFVAEDKGMAILRNWTADDPLDWIEVIVDYGKYGGRFHGHPTKLSILTAFNGQVGSQDFGDLTRGATEGTNDWFMGGYSHNTVQVDHRHHRTAGGPVPIGELIAAGGDATLSWIDAHSDRMFDGVTLRRTTFVSDVGIVEFTLCKSDREHVYDWPYHNFGIATTDVALAPTDVSKQGLLRFAENARAGAADGVIHVTWKDTPLSTPPRKGRTSLIDGAVFARLWALPEAGTELLLFAGPTIESITEEKQIDYAMLRRRTDRTVFATVIEPWREATGPKIDAIEKLPVLADGEPVADTEAVALKITRVDGKVQVFLVNYSGGEKTVGEVTSTAAGAATWTLDADGRATDRRGSAVAP